MFARSDRNARKHHGISAYIVEKDTPGFSFGKKESKLGIRASSTRELVFDNCRIPAENLLGTENEGFKLGMMTLDGGRIGIAAQALGIAQGAFDAAVEYMKERTQFDKPLTAFQGLQFKIADLATMIEAARLLVYQAAWKAGAKLPYGKDSAMAKMYASDTAMRVATEAVQLFGGYGFTRISPWNGCFATPRSPRSTKVPTKSSGLSSAAPCCVELFMGIES